MSLQVDKIPPNIRDRVEDKGLYVCSAHMEEWRRGKQRLQSLGNRGGRPIATIRATNSGIREKDAAYDAAGGPPSSASLRRGSRSMLTKGVCQEWGIYNGAIGDAIDISHREGKTPPTDNPEAALSDSPKYGGPLPRAA